MKITHLIKKCLYTVSSEDEDQIVQEYIRSLRIAREMKLKCKKFLIKKDTDEVKAEQADIVTENNDTKVSTEEEAVSVVNGPAIQASDITVVNDSEQIWYLDDLEQLLSNDSIKANTLSKRVSSMKLLMKLLNKDDFRLSYIEPTNYLNIVNVLKESRLACWTQKKVIGIISIIYNIFNIDANTWKYSEIDEYYKFLDANTREHILSDRERTAYENKNHDILEKALDNFPTSNFILEGDFIQLQNLLIILLYNNKLPPLRSEWLINMGVDCRNVSENWIESNNLVVHMNSFKGMDPIKKPKFTFSLYNWDNLLVNVMVGYLHRRAMLIASGKINHTQLISSSKYKQIIGSSNVNKIMNNIFGKGVSVNILRKQYETNLERKFKGKITKKLLSEIRRISGHCAEIAETVYHNELLIDAESSDDSDNDV